MGKFCNDSTFLKTYGINPILSGSYFWRHGWSFSKKVGGVRKPKFSEELDGRVSEVESAYRGMTAVDRAGGGGGVGAKINVCGAKGNVGGATGPGNRTKSQQAKSQRTKSQRTKSQMQKVKRTKSQTQKVEKAKSRKDKKSTGKKSNGKKSNAKSQIGKKLG